MKRTILTAGVFASCVLVGCKVDDPPERLRMCLANMDRASGPAGQDVECDLGKRSYLIAVPGHVADADLKPIALPDYIRSTLKDAGATGPKWCWLTTKGGGSPARVMSNETALDVDHYTLEWAEAGVEIDHPAVADAKIIRLHVLRERDGTPHVTSVQAARR